MNPSTILQIATDLLDEDIDTTDGICHACGETQSGCAPDAREYECESCGEHKVYGTMETVLMLG